jgi:hypothetical protein
LRIFRKSVEEIQFDYNLTRITNTLHKDLCIFMIIYHPIIFRIKKYFKQICRENQNTFCAQYFFFPKSFPFMRCCGRKRYSKTSQRLEYNTARKGCELHAGKLKQKYRNTHTYIHSKYVIFIALPKPQWLTERGILLLYTLHSCLLFFEKLNIFLVLRKMSQSVYRNVM